MTDREAMCGYEYSYVNEMTGKKGTNRIYYEKDMQGDVIGLLDSRGEEIATYSYDAWGNITETMCYDGNETAYALNHVTYRGYYRDEESGFYYLQSRYYDPEIGRFINADEACYLGISGTIWANKVLYSNYIKKRYRNADIIGVKSVMDICLSYQKYVWV